MKKILLYLTSSILIVFAAACTQQPLANSPATPPLQEIKETPQGTMTTTDQPAAAVTKTAAEPSPTPVVCAPLPEGMTVQAKPIAPDSESILIEVTELQPGEKLTLIYTTEIPGERSLEIESRPAAAVGEDGRFTDTQTLIPLPGSSENRWKIKVIHARGVACSDIVIP